jgi:hypothetical protein
VTEPITRVPAPRVPFLDERTGAVSREWYRFLISLTGQVDATTDQINQDFTVAPGTTQGASDITVLQTQLTAQDLLPPPPIAAPARYYGTFVDVSLQTAAVINTAYAVEFDTPVVEFGVRIASASRVTFDAPGRYLLAATLNAQLNAAPAGNLSVWLRIDGSTSVTNSATLTQVVAPTTLARSFLVDVAAGQYVEVMWAVSDTDVRLQAAAAAAPVPGVPSASLIVIGVL